MPITFAHPLAVIPFRRTKLDFTALIVGSMSPDFLYFIRLSAQAHYGHTFSGVFFFCVPVGLILIWLFHFIMKKPLLALLPLSHQISLSPPSAQYKFGPRSRFLLIILSLVFGALTHILWDSFTHEHGWSVQRWPFLQQRLITILSFDLKLYKALQYAGGLIGTPFLFWLYWRERKAGIPTTTLFFEYYSPSQKLAIVFALASSAFAVAIWYAFSQSNPFLSANSLYVFIGLTVVTSISAGFVLTLGYSLYFRFKHRD